MASARYPFATIGGRMAPGTRERTRRKLVDAAMDVVAKRGYQRASVDEVAGAAGYSVGALYSNFASKDELLLAIVDEHFAWGERALADAPAHAGLAEWLGAFDDWPRQFRLFIEFWAYAVDDDELRERLAGRMRALRAAVAAAIERSAAAHGRELPRPAEDLAVAALALTRGLIIEGMADPRAVPPDLLPWVAERLAG